MPVFFFDRIRNRGKWSLPVRQNLPTDGLLKGLQKRAEAPVKFVAAQFEFRRDSSFRRFLPG